MKRLPILVFLIAVLLVGPWGDFPLSDDWQYARTAKHFAETGRFVVDTAVAPALVGQTLLAAPVIWIFGFSHAKLRALTLVLSVLLLFALGELLRLVDVDEKTQRLTLLLVGLNPLYLFFATSFMTEIYGYVPAFLAAVVWFRDRRSRDLEGGALVFSGPCALAALLSAASFWIRQYGVLVFPALVGSALLGAAFRGEWRRIRASLAAISLGIGLLAGGVLGYFSWARSGGNLRPEFTTHLDSMFRLNREAWLLQSGIFVCYMTVFTLPLLLLAPRRKGSSSGIALAGIPIAGLALLSFAMLRRASSDFDMGDFWHRTFPFIGNILYNAGVGAVTLSDVYILNLPLRPRWPRPVWEIVEFCLLTGSVLWAPAVLGFLGVWRKRGRAGELVSFALLLALGSFALSVQAYRFTLFDRYYFPSFLGFALALGVLVSERREARGFPFFVALAPVALFAIAGVHDEFRWNDARWALYRDAVSSGIPRDTIEAGYEIDGWFLFDSYKEGARVDRCLGTCDCDAGWFCRDNSYTIAMNPRVGYRALAQRQPHYWLAKGPPLLLLKRFRGE
jgi:hypothetical protein